MPIPTNIDMSSIREALERRLSGGAPTIPTGQQMTQPASPSPTGATPVPTNTPPPVPNPSMGQVSGVTQAKVKPPQPQYDDETRMITKSLIQKLMQAL